MHPNKTIIALVLVAITIVNANAQNEKVQQGLLLKTSTGIRLGGIQILNKRTLSKTRSSTFGVFNITASQGDTLSFTGDNLQSKNIIIADFADKVIYLDPAIQLDEVVVKEYSIKSDIKEVQRGYREKSVFYIGTPHYYYLVLKPMTFIYENFKSEVREARRFNRYARQEMALCQVTARFNDTIIKRAIPINNNQLEDFKLAYMPTLKQINSWDDYQLINYIKSSYADFKKNGADYRCLNL